MRDDLALTTAIMGGTLDLEVHMSNPKKPSKNAIARGKARSESMTPEQRRESARHAAQQRWAGKGPLIPKETHPGVLKVADIELPCAVLDTGTRVFSQRGMFSALGGGRRDRGD